MKADAQAIRSNTAAERQRLRRRRRRLDLMPVRVEVSRDARDAMIDAGFLAAWDEDDRAAVRAAAQAIFDNLDPFALTERHDVTGGTEDDC